jgi:uncharacterized protein (TIGR00252 family)
MDDEGSASGSDSQQAARGARKRLGDAGERLAAGWLEQRGYAIVARNWRCQYGELDVVAVRAGELVFVEMKTRRGERLGTPEEAITPAKRRRLAAAAACYVADHGLDEASYRIDVIAIDLAPGGRLRAIRHYPAAVAEEE